MVTAIAIGMFFIGVIMGAAIVWASNWVNGRYK